MNVHQEIVHLLMDHGIEQSKARIIRDRIMALLGSAQPSNVYPEVDNPEIMRSRPVNQLEDEDPDLDRPMGGSNFNI